MQRSQTGEEGTEENRPGAGRPGRRGGRMHGHEGFLQGRESESPDCTPNEYRLPTGLGRGGGAAAGVGRAFAGVHFSAGCVQFFRRCVQWGSGEGRAQRSESRSGRLGMGRGRKARFPIRQAQGRLFDRLRAGSRLRCAALGMTGAAGRQVSTRVGTMCPLLGWMCPVFAGMCPVFG